MVFPTTQPSTTAIDAAWRQGPLARDPPSTFSVTWLGWILVPRGGAWTFATTTDYRSSVSVDNTWVVDNRGSHRAPRASGTIDLGAGIHPIFVEFSQTGGAYQLELSWARGGAPLAPVPAWVLTSQRVAAPRIVLAHVLAGAAPVARWLWLGIAAAAGVTLVAGPLVFALGRELVRGWGSGGLLNRDGGTLTHPIGLGEMRRVMAMGLVFVGTLVPRVWGIEQHFWMQGDQTRDWGIALGPFTHLPLIGPPTGVGGYTIGPAFYWILWGIRVLVEPWFHNLPHGGGVGQAVLDSGADALLLVAIWRRTRSFPIAFATIVLVATAPFDLSLAAVIWNPVMGAILAKVATALVLLDWNDTPWRTGATVCVAWAAVQCHTPTIFVAVSVFVALVARWVQIAGWKTAARRTLLIGAVVATLQIPYVVHQWSARFSESGLGAVGVSLSRIANGTAPIEMGPSATAYAAAVQHIEAGGWHVPALPVWLVVGALLTGFRFRRDLPLLSVTLLPQAAAVVGFAFWVGGFNEYYCLSLMPAVVLTAVLAVVALWPPRASAAVGFAAMVAVLGIAPARLRSAETMGRMPEYGALVKGSLTLLESRERVRDIATDFPLPSTTDPAFVYSSLGGHLDERASQIAVIRPDGSVVYR